MDRKRVPSHRTADRIVDYLRRQPSTIDEVASAMGITRTAVRAQLATLQQLGVVEERGQRRGTSKPARLYGVTAEAVLNRSRAYAPVLSLLIQAMSSRLDESEMEAIMQATGRGLMSGLTIPTGGLSDRVQSAVSVLGQLGAVADVTADNGGFMIRGYGCPLAVAAAEHRGACQTLESFLSAYLSTKVVARCDENGRQHCCFKVSGSA